MKVRPWSIRPDLRLTAHVVAGRYRLDDLLGRGGAADVYEGLDLRLRRPIAVKVFRPESAVQTEERFDHEGRLLARLEHPGLVTVYDSGQEDGQPYLVMQLIKGTTLRRRIATAPLTPGEAGRTGAALASVLAHVHAAGVVHRDVKPSNILLDGAGAPHLTDFGISRLLDTTAHTSTGTLVGTAAYMAPEQVLGQGAGPAADVYSLGLVLLESLKGELEYAGAPMEAAIARLHRPPVIPADLPRDLVALLEAMTDPDENSRPDADACSRALAAVPDARPALPLPGARPPGDDHDPADDTLHSQDTDARTGGAGAVDAAAPGDGRAAPEPAVPAPAPSFRTGRALLTAGAALAVFGVTLTGSIDGRPVEGEGAVPPPRVAVTDPPSASVDHPDPSPPSPAVPASDPGPLTSSPTDTSDTAAGRTGPTADERPETGTDADAEGAPATYRDGQGNARGNAAGGPGRDETDAKPAKVKPPKEEKGHKHGGGSPGGGQRR
ncbi:MULTISPECIES: serine/threonine-protein kinase [Streptomyces]|uniref:non-specific serine/threonine protein kinase n=1 Tax=Streptomyces changanensis TaxID=2964669 RepID=A0ABY5N2V1_9ACTN|nr:MULTISPECIES: serine/threonine-protein kinase [Streptomyces]UUS29470.1 serine/threonine protein kinase [Streptomyces changanensis]